MPETPTRINYAALARAAGVRRPITLRPIFTTRQQERDLAAMYLRIVQIWVEGATQRILPVYGRSLAQYTGDSPADLQVEIGVVENNAIQAILSGFAAAYSDWFSDLVLWHINKLGSQLPYVDNITLRTQLGPARETLEDLLARNVALVRNVSDQTRGRISDIVFRGLQARTPSRDIAREIAEATGLGRKRSLRIAADQTVKAAAALDRVRQEQLGFDRFVWKHSGKRHYRPEHRERDGLVFEWDSAVGRGDPPGFLPYCGCHARAYLDPSEGG